MLLLLGLGIAVLGTCSTKKYVVYVKKETNAWSTLALMFGMALLALL